MRRMYVCSSDILFLGAGTCDIGRSSLADFERNMELLYELVPPLQSLSYPAIHPQSHPRSTYAHLQPSMHASADARTRTRPRTRTHGTVGGTVQRQPDLGYTEHRARE